MRIDKNTQETETPKNEINCWNQMTNDADNFIKSIVVAVRTQKGR